MHVIILASETGFLADIAFAVELIALAIFAFIFRSKDKRLHH